MYHETKGKKFIKNHFILQGKYNRVRDLRNETVIPFHILEHSLTYYNSCL